MTLRYQRHLPGAAFSSTYFESSMHHIKVLWLLVTKFISLGSYTLNWLVLVRVNLCSGSQYVQCTADRNVLNHIMMQ